METRLIKIFKGEDKAIKLRIRDSITKDPVDLTGKVLTGRIEGCPTNVDVATDAFVVDSATLGQVTMNLTDVHTSALKEGVISFQVILTEGADVKKVNFENKLEVVESI